MGQFELGPVVSSLRGASSDRSSAGSGSAQVHHSVLAVSDGTLVFPGMVFPQFTHFGIAGLFRFPCS